MNIHRYSQDIEHGEGKYRFFWQVSPPPSQNMFHFRLNSSLLHKKTCYQSCQIFNCRVAFAFNQKNQLQTFMFYLCSLLLCRLLWSVAENKSSEELQLTFPFFFFIIIIISLPSIHPFEGETNVGVTENTERR